jgi:vancomycin resistance protein VanJ
LSDVRPADIRPEGFPASRQRGLQATVSAPGGEIVVYVVHLPSVRLGATGLTSAARDESAALLGTLAADDPASRLLLVGDLNGTVRDRGLGPLTSRPHAQPSGFAFSRPAALPVVRIGQGLGRGVAGVGAGGDRKRPPSGARPRTPAVGGRGAPGSSRGESR